METKTKLKIKLSESPLFWQSKYEFVAPYDFDECIRRINVLGAKYWDEDLELWRLFFPQPKFRIDSQEDNGGVFNFKMNGSQSRVTFDAELRGQLLYENDRQTHIKAMVGVTRSSTIWLIALILMIFVLFCVTAGINIPSFILTLFMIGFVLLIQAFYGYSLKAQLYYDLYEALSIKPAPRPMTLPR